MGGDALDMRAGDAATACSPHANAATVRDDGPVGDYLTRVARRLGADRAWLVCARDADELAAHLVDEGTARIVGVLGGTPVGVVDLRALAADMGDGALVADVSAATTHGCPACRLGASLAFAQVDGGAFVVAAARGAERALPGVTGRVARLPVPGAARAHAIARADADVAACWRAASDAAAVVASYLRCHPAIARVRYPGLKDDPSFAVAARTLTGGFGATVSYATVDDPDTWHSVVAEPDDPHAQVMSLEHRLGSTITDGPAPSSIPGSARSSMPALPDELCGCTRGSGRG